jgi:hypothetical protein
MPHVTMKAIQAAIDARAETDARYRNVEFVKGEGYFYLAPKELDGPFALDGANAQSIYVYALKHLSFDRWMSEIETLLLWADEHRGTPPSGERSRN